MQDVRGSALSVSICRFLYGFPTLPVNILLIFMISLRLAPSLKCSDEKCQQGWKGWSWFTRRVFLFMICTKAKLQVGLQKLNRLQVSRKRFQECHSVSEVRHFCRSIETVIISVTGIERFLLDRIGWYLTKRDVEKRAHGFLSCRLMWQHTYHLWNICVIVRCITGHATCIYRRRRFKSHMPEQNVGVPF